MFDVEILFGEGADLDEIFDQLDDNGDEEVGIMLESGPHLQKRGPIQIFSIYFSIKYVLSNQFALV